MVANRMFSSRLVLSSKLAIEGKSADRLTVFHTRTLCRLELSNSLYRLICDKFIRPAYFLEVIPPHLQDDLHGPVSQLIEKGFLITEGENDELAGQLVEKRLSLASHTLFNSRRNQKDGERTDVAVVGVPYDLGNAVAAGARRAPEQIRLCSYDYDSQSDFLTGRPLGWVDGDRGERILEGKTISDWGNLWFRYGESPDRIFRRLGDVCDEIVDARSFPLFIGGDHSITFPIVKRLQSKQELAVLWFDAHNDYGEFVPGICCDHRNVARHIAMLPNVKKLVQVGFRCYTVYDEDHKDEQKISTITPSDLRLYGADAILAALPESLPTYISVDIDVLDPIYAPGTSTPVPGGLSFLELKEALRTVGAARNIAGLDLVEVNPEKDVEQITSIVACNLLITALGSILSRRQPEVNEKQEQTI